MTHRAGFVGRMGPPARKRGFSVDFSASTSLSALFTFTRASTATYFNSSGVLTSAATDVARLDYDPATLAPRGLLLEGARTNDRVYSEAFDNGAWAKGGLNAFGGGSVANTTATTDPYGTNVAEYIQEDTSTGSHRVQLGTAKAASALPYAFSIFAKAAERTQIWMQLDNGATDGVRAVFNLSAGTVGAATAVGVGFTSMGATIQALPNGWYRCIVTGTSDTAVNIRTQAMLYDGSTNSYTGNGTSGAYIFGAQLEAATSASSYIPTTSAAATRAADVCTMTGTPFSTNFPNASTACSVLAGWMPMSAAANQRVLTISTGADTDRLCIRHTSSGTQGVGEVETGGVSQMSAANATITAFAVNKIAVGWTTDNSAISVNGSAVTSDASVTMPSGLNQIRLCASAAGSNAGFGWLSVLRYYVSRLDNANLQTVST